MRERWRTFLSTTTTAPRNQTLTSFSSLNLSLYLHTPHLQRPRRRHREQRHLLHELVGGAGHEQRRAVVQRAV